MKTIKVHDMPSAVDETYLAETFEEFLVGQRRGARRSPSKRLGELFSANFIDACWFHWAGDEAMARRSLNASVECASAVFLASSVTGEIEFPFDGEIIRAPAGPVAHETQHTVAVEAFLLAQIVRRQELLPPILEFPREELDLRSGAEGDPFRLFLLGAFREYHSDPDNDAWRKSLDEFERLCAPEF